LEIPKSTPNAITLLELGVVPIEVAIRSRQLNFLQRILKFEDNDPVKRTYLEQKKFVAEENWAKEMAATRIRFAITESDTEIRDLTKSQWKTIVGRQAKRVALEHLLQLRLKKGAGLDYEEIKIKQYFKELSAGDARLVFRLRAEIYDIKANRRYQYNDTVCRLCDSDVESLDHIVNECAEIPRSSTIIKLDTDDMGDIRTIIRRVRCFEDLINLS
jgi:hypothetical protein